jgi:hypothetical protein
MRESRSAELLQNATLFIGLSLFPRSEVNENRFSTPGRRLPLKRTEEASESPLARLRRD